MLQYEPTVHDDSRHPQDPAYQFSAIIQTIYHHERKLIDELRQAGAILYLPLTAILYSTIGRYGQRFCGPINATPPPIMLPRLSDEELFVECRNVMASDHSERMWQKHGFTYGMVREAILQETIRLSYGDDPTQPW